RLLRQNQERLAATCSEAEQLPDFTDFFIKTDVTQVSQPGFCNATFMSLLHTCNLKNLKREINLALLRKVS
ncbi:MAG TPA: hypothetical protein PLA27_07480, partial [Anaerolineales bacterium]|nr:hypothetical protein [Anaerolineales bacterium]